LIERMSVERAPVTAFAPRTQAARAYRELWAELTAPMPAQQRPAVLSQRPVPAR
jgi:hypothetical protein